MPDFNVIADVSRTLQRFLTQGFSTLVPAPPPVAEIHDLQGNISTDPARLTLFLFEVIEDPSQRNRPPVRTDLPAPATPSVRISKPPMALLLKYMMTAWSGDRFTDHQILGRTLQVLYDGAILSGPQLLGATLQNTSVALKITLTPITLEERSRVFYAVQKPYRLSLTYDVRVVDLDTRTSQGRVPVVSREIRPSIAEAQP
ncbi:MAG: DUF4255 domain-containing protein [Acidobacteria bacterium]|nr:DUF4255 domain-containing protein [Acidobacteriota bacterium]